MGHVGDQVAPQAFLTAERVHHLIERDGKVAQLPGCSQRTRAGVQLAAAPGTGSVDQAINGQRDPARYGQRYEQGERRGQPGRDGNRSQQISAQCLVRLSQADPGELDQHLPDHAPVLRHWRTALKPGRQPAVSRR